MQEEKVDKAIQKIIELPSEKTQRAWVMKVLEGVRGLSIAEIGSVNGSAGRKRGSGEKAARKGNEHVVMTMDMDGADGAGGGGGRPQSPEFGGVSELFG